MNIANLIPVDGTGFISPFFEEPKADGYYKIYHDGGSYIATRCVRSQKKNRSGVRFRDGVDILFDSLYFEAQKQGLKDGKVDKSLTNFIRSGIIKLYGTSDDLDEYIEKKLKSKRHNLAVRKKRFRRKANLNRWNYFVTFTYDDLKQTAESFRRKLRKCLSNLHTRRGWKYMGVFECAPQTGRLHFHGLLYIPDGEMVGEIIEKKDYDTVDKRVQTRHENEFFLSCFGRNDFTELSECQLQYGHTIDYIVKYIGKTNEKICYSRGIPTEVYKQLTGESIITDFMDFVEKFILFDNAIDYERDVLRLKYAKQVTFIDLLCHPPHVANCYV